MRFISVKRCGFDSHLPHPIILMTKEEIFQIYILQSRNVRKLGKIKKSLVREINHHLKKSDEYQVDLRTKLLALLYCAWSEAQFIQIVHTPNSFSSSEIDNIKQVKDKQGIVEGWNKMIEIALSKVGRWQKGSDLPNRKKKLLSIIKEYIQEPSQLRNKIAHGQWVVALNRENTAQNQELTQKLQTLDFVEITKWFKVHSFLGFIVRDLVQSPQKGFHNNYWTNLTELEMYLNRTKRWNTTSKKIELSRKPSKISQVNE